MSPFIKNMLTVLRGTVMGQLILFASLPILSRIFTPDAFGTLQSIQSVLSLLLIVCSLRLEIAILSSTDEELPHILVACVALCGLTSVLTLLVISGLWIFFRHTLSQWGVAAFFLPICLLFAGAGQILSYLGLRLQAFGISATAKVAQSVVYSATAMVIGSLYHSTLGLMFADALGRTALVLASLRGEFLATLRKRRMIGIATWQAVRSNKNLPLFSMPSAIINVLGSSFTAVMLLAIFNAKEAGTYAMVERMLGAPVTLLAGAASQAFMATLSRSCQDSQEKKTLFLRIIKTNAALAALPALVLMVVAPSLVPWLLGPEWTTAGIYTRILVPMLYIAFMAIPVNMTLVLCDKQAWQLGWDVSRLVAFACLWWIVGANSYNARSAIIAYSSIASLFYLAHIVLCYFALETFEHPSNPNGVLSERN